MECSASRAYGANVGSGGVGVGCQSFGAGICAASRGRENGTKLICHDLYHDDQSTRMGPMQADKIRLLVKNYSEDTVVAVERRGSVRNVVLPPQSQRDRLRFPPEIWTKGRSIQGFSNFGRQNLGS
ncbi:hypothetical protein BDW67DRAFT_166678 [Aspergillus spinulosporus]